MREETAGSVVEAFGKAIDIITTWKGDQKDNPYCWFRGVDSDQYDLTPGAYWRKEYDEYQPLVTFVQEGVAYTEIGDIDSWDTYYLAQHHGIPTRLLDWTESFSAALYFALDTFTAGTTPCIWIVRPEAINQLSLKWEGILGPATNAEYAALWLPRNIRADSYMTLRDAEGYVYDNNLPLAIYPRKSNRRIVAQQGAFTVHGRSRQSINEFIEERSKDPNSMLARILLTGIDKEEAQFQLETLGVRRHSVFPDIDNFVKWMKSDYEW